MDAKTSGAGPRTGYGRSWAAAGEVDTFDQFVEDFHAGRISPDGFKRFRLQHGVYGQRQQDVQMIRVKIPWGGLTAAQLDGLADVAEHTLRRVGHVTTRQNIQFHFVPRHHIAGIGLYGGARKFHDEQAPTYQLPLGATLAAGRARFGKPVARVSAKQVPDAVKALLELYRAERKPEETFDAFVDRAEPERLRSVLAPWTELPPSSEAPEKYLDWGADEKFRLETGPGECAA